MLKYLRKAFPFYLFIDLILITSICYIVYLFRYNTIDYIFTQVRLPNLREYSFIFLLWVVFLTAYFKKSSLYTTDRNLTIPKEILKVIINIFYASVLVGIVIFFAQYEFYSREIFIEIFILLCIVLSGWRTIKRLILRKLIAEGFHNTNVVIIGAGRIGRIILEEIRRNPQWGFNIIGFLDDSKTGAVNNMPILGKLDGIVENAKRYFVDEVIITIPSELRRIAEFVKQIKKLGLGIKMVPENVEGQLPILDIIHVGITPLLVYREKRHNPSGFIFKRIFDLVISLFLLVLFLPIFIVIALFIKLDSPGPVFYIQKRAGFKGKTFNLYKFRSMINEADKLKTILAEKNESKGNVIFKIKRDPRITAVGRILRKCSLDELSQLINVLKGDMSLVGPRPFPVEESKKLEYNHMERLTVRPGITGLAQIRGRSDLSFYRWVKWDLWYVNNWSFWLDLKILLRTIPVVLKRKGAY